MQNHREVIEKKRENKRESRGDFVELRENREYGEFSWRLGELEPVLADLQFLDAGVQG